MHKIAIQGGAEEVLRLLNLGTDVNVRASDQATPLHYAAYMQHLKVVNILLKNGANILAKDKNGWTPLVAAMSISKIIEPPTIKLLINNGANIDVKNIQNKTALLLAIEWLGGYTAHAMPEGWGVKKYDKILFSFTFIEWLIINGANVNLSDSIQVTPLQRAVMINREDIVILLTKNDANVNAEARNGITPLKLAVKRKNKNIERILIKYGHCCPVNFKHLF